MEVTFKLAPGEALHRRQHARAACPQGVFRHRQALAAGLLRRQGRAAVDACGDRGDELQGGRRMSGQDLDRDNDRRVPRRHLRAARRGGLSRRAGDHGRAHAAGRVARRAGRRARTSWSPRRCCTTSATSPASSAPIRRTMSRTSIMTKPAREVLAPFFPPVIVECVRLHVAAKRYLCATDPTYFGKLSQASVHTLSLQGGPMNADGGRRVPQEPVPRRGGAGPHLGRGRQGRRHEDAGVSRLRAAAAAGRQRLCQSRLTRNSSQGRERPCASASTARML